MTDPRRGHSQGVILALLSRRLRTWLLLVVVVPVVGTALERAGDRVTPRNAALGSALSRAGGLARAARPGQAGAGRARGR